jgi:hypothetical protein
MGVCVSTSGSRGILVLTFSPFELCFDLSLLHAAFSIPPVERRILFFHVLCDVCRMAFIMCL